MTFKLILDRLRLDSKIIQVFVANNGSGRMHFVFMKMFRFLVNLNFVRVKPENLEELRH